MVESLVSSPATFIVYRADECPREAVTLKLDGIAVPGIKFLSPDKTRAASVPAFFIQAIDWVANNICDKTIGKEDFQKKMQEIARSHGLAKEGKAGRQYFARWSEMSTLGYRQNPGWIAWLQPAESPTGTGRYYRVFSEGEQPKSAAMLTREFSPNFGQGKEKKAKESIEDIVNRKVQETLIKMGLVPAPEAVEDTSNAEDTGEVLDTPYTEEEVATEEVTEQSTVEVIDEEVATEEVAEQAAEEVATEEAVEEAPKNNKKNKNQRR
jgi:hypothetical protein